MLYIYNLECLSASDQNAFISVVDRVGEGLCRIGERDLEKTVAQCLEELAPMEIRGFEPLTQQEGEPFLLMDIDDLEVDPFLAQLRQNKVRIGHKCMVTEKKSQLEGAEADRRRRRRARDDDSACEPAADAGADRRFRGKRLRSAALADLHQQKTGGRGSARARRQSADLC